MIQYTETPFGAYIGTKSKQKFTKSPPVQLKNNFSVFRIGSKNQLYLHRHIVRNGSDFMDKTE